jgi:hypothetical protein
MLLRSLILLVLLAGLAGCADTRTAAEVHAYKCEWSHYYPEVWGKCGGPAVYTGVTPEMVEGMPAVDWMQPGAVTTTIVRPDGAGGWVEYEYE